MHKILFVEHAQTKCLYAASSAGSAARRTKIGVGVFLWGGLIQCLSGSWCIKGTGESTLAMDSAVLLMHHDPDRSWITDLDPDYPKGTPGRNAPCQTVMIVDDS